MHQACVTLRRLRSVIKLFAPVPPPEFVAAYGQTWQTLGSALGEARTRDIFLTETLPSCMSVFPNDKHSKCLHKAAQRKIQSTRKLIIHLLVTDEYPRMLLEFTAAVYAAGPTLPILLEDFARQQISCYAARLANLRFITQIYLLANGTQCALRSKSCVMRWSFLQNFPSKHLMPYASALLQLQDKKDELKNMLAIRQRQRPF